MQVTDTAIQEPYHTVSLSSVIVLVTCILYSDKAWVEYLQCGLQAVFRRIDCYLGSQAFESSKSIKINSEALPVFVFFIGGRPCLGKVCT
ncbi:hypothetical protein J6590_042294 [Homalodisca vitripennis]|nr:hypothetical protein J6590_042294 [Homalodisca vitripennis]